MFSKKGSLAVTKGQPMVARQQTIELKANSTRDFMKADKFEKSEQGGSRRSGFIYSAAAVQGFRSKIQDDYKCVSELELKGRSYSYFAVFDGHGEVGEIVSQFCADNVLTQLLKRKAFRQSKVITNELLQSSMEKTLVKLDEQLRTVQGVGGATQFGFSGTTACMVFLSPDDITFVNVGDSRALLCRSGSVVFETSDHNPDCPAEEERITRAGGRVHTTPSRHKIISDPEGFNNLCVSRTIGDFDFKPPSSLPPQLQAVTPSPDATVIPREIGSDQFLLVASDGVFKSMSSRQVVDYVLREMMITEDLTTICRKLIDTAYYADGNIPDDTTVVIVKFSAAPSLSPQAIAEEKQLEAEALSIIEKEIKMMVGKADVVRAVDNDFSITQHLVHKLPEQYRVQERVPFIMETAERLRQEKFGNPHKLPSPSGASGHVTKAPDHVAQSAQSQTEDCDVDFCVICLSDGEEDDKTCPLNNTRATQQ